MSRIAARFAELKTAGEKALVAYIAAGDPTMEATSAIVKGMEAAGVDMVELGLPFSDPLADGPTIQAGSQRALAGGIDTDKFFDMVKAMRADGVRLPLLIMTYYNLLLRPGLERFCARAREAGIDGLIIPDLPVEEADELVAVTRQQGLDLIQFVAPTSPPERVKAAATLATGFVYCVSLTGVTGERNAISERFQAALQEAKAQTATPVLVGFGISTPEQVREVAALGDGVIVGSAIVRICGEALPQAEMVAKVSRFVGELKAATRNIAK